ncbi:TPA: hypothetical protein N0F65_005118, partial [Lagenidium giganteum]
STASSNVTWIGAKFFEAAVTNNNTEYRALKLGLEKASQACLTPLHVIGNRNMIITQLASRRPPRAAHLRGLHATVRRLADEIGVCSWQHHYRRYNKMADAAANIAINTSASHQVAMVDLSNWFQVTRHCESDLAQWDQALSVHISI